MWFPDQQHQLTGYLIPHPGPRPRLTKIENGGGCWHSAISVLTSPPGDSDACKSLRTTVLSYSVDIEN